MKVILKGISKTFLTQGGKVGAVSDLSLEIAHGEFFALLGPSGCGKTTTMRCVAGLETPDKGEIWMGDHLVFSRKDKKMVPVNQRNIGMVFQSYAIWPHMNVFDNVAYPLKYGMKNRPSGSEVKDRVLNALELVGLKGYDSRPATQLSGGQQQRVALARAFVRNPEVFLFDEPLSNLDAKLRQEMRIELRQLLKKIGGTAIYVTHDQAEAFAIADRVGVMLSGKLVQVGTPRDIYSRPANAFVADFVGRINPLEGKVVRSEDQPEKKLVITSIGQLECPGLENIAEGQSVKLGIRAEAIKLGDFSGGKDNNAFTGIIKNSVFLGEYMDCEIVVQDQSFRVKVPPEIGTEVGSQVGIQFPANSLVLLM